MRDSGVNIFVKCHNANNNIEREIIIKNHKKKNYKKQRTNHKLYIIICKLQKPFRLLIFFLGYILFLVKRAIFRNRYDDISLISDHFLLFYRGWLFQMVGFN